MYLQIWLITSFKIFKISTQQTINCPQNMLKVNTVVVNTEDRHSSGAFSVQFEHTSYVVLVFLLLTLTIYFFAKYTN